jgi:molybdenum cofactor cytidylyltransferase
MKFASFELADAEGAILAHAVKLDTMTFKKGRVLSVADIKLLRTSNIHLVIAAKLGADDVPEDVAAHKIAAAVCGQHMQAQEAFTGRANLYAAAAGLVVIDEVRLRTINHLHESLTLATLPPYARVENRDMVATIKVIPFAVPRDVFDAALKIIGDKPLISVAPFKDLRVGLIITRLPQTKEQLIAKSESAMRDRVHALGGELVAVAVCDHTDVAAIWCFRDC